MPIPVIVILREVMGSTIRVYKSVLKVNKAVFVIRLKSQLELFFKVFCLVYLSFEVNKAVFI